MEDEEVCIDCGKPVTDGSGTCSDCCEKDLAPLKERPMGKKKMLVTEEKTAQSWLDGLDDPDNVGQSEYRIIHELLNELDLSECDSEASKIEHMKATLDEIKGWSESLIASLNKHSKGTPKAAGKKAPSKTGSDLKKFRVTVARSCPQYRAIPVFAKDEEEAKAKALEQVGDIDFSDGTAGAEAEYDAESVELVD